MYESREPDTAESAPEPPVLVLTGLSKAYPRKVGRETTQVKVLDDISFSVSRGEFLTIIGPSGCGKSTLLGCIAGLVPYEVGDISFAGERVQTPGRERAVVFQQPCLLPWRTVRRNIEYGLELQGVTSRGERRERASAALSLVGLAGSEDLYPHQISGGMQQRTNLARALATSPELMLMDEPFGALDALTRETMQDELCDLASRTGRTTVFITHDIEEAVLLGDRVLVMEARPGTIATILEVGFPRPRSRQLAENVAFQATVRELRQMLQHAPRATAATAAATAATAAATA